jgi:hypothetical protein
MEKVPFLCFPFASDPFVTPKNTPIVVVTQYRKYVLWSILKIYAANVA